jgi:poly(A) polymerase
VHKSALAIIVPKYASEDFIQQVRKEHDPQVNRWPPHINLLYPFHEDIVLDISQDEEASVISNIFECLSRFKPFECDFEKISTFDNNNVVFLEPSKNAKDQMKLIYDALIELFDLDK